MPTSAAILCFDIGNSNTNYAKFVANQLVFKGNFPTDKNSKASFFGKQFELADNSGLFDSVVKIAIASVVPEIDQLFNKFLSERIAVNPIWINSENCNNLNFLISEPESVGADRIANAVAAREIYGAPALVVDVGTATSFDFVSADGSFAGGVIMPGPKISFEALKAKASKLSDIKLDWPKNIIGTNTAEAINSGVHYGHLFAVEGLVAAVKLEFPELKNVVVTGGAGTLLLENSNFFNVYDPDLTLKGIHLIAQQNG